MCYQAEFLIQVWKKYLSENNVQEGDVDPDDFVRFAYAQAMAHRQPRYSAMAKNWGISVGAAEIANATTPAEFKSLIARALEMRG